jgi:hypothetical protein
VLEGVEHLGHGHRLAGERRLIHLEVDERRDEAHVGRQQVAGAEDDDVAEHQLAARHGEERAGTQHRRRGRREGAQRVHRLLGAPLLHEADGHVDEDDDGDDGTLDPVAHAKRQRHGGEQDDGERIGHLAQQNVARRDLFALADRVGPVGREARRGSVGREAGVGVRVERRKDGVGGENVRQQRVGVTRQ